jgi:hypothetical protein
MSHGRGRATVREIAMVGPRSGTEATAHFSHLRKRPTSSQQSSVRCICACASSAATAGACCPGDVEFARKDVMQLRSNDEIEILIRFRDMKGGFPINCHNTVHEDHQMMMLYDVQDRGDNKTQA